MVKEGAAFQASPDATVQFDLLGPFRVTREGTALDIGGGKQQLVLVALLLARGAVVSTDRLVDLVWGEEPPNKPHVTLRSYVSHLRRVLEPDREAGARPSILITRAPGYALEVDQSAIDLFRFEEALATARSRFAEGDPARAHERLAAGLELWRSPQLGQGLLEPTDPEVVRLAELRLGAQTFEQELLLGLGRHEEALPRLEAMLADDPTQEGARRLHMLALYRAGRRRDALSSFQAGRTAIIDELGLEPSTELRDLESAILDDDASLRWAGPAALPPTTSVEPPIDELPEAPAGRQQEADLLTQRLVLAAEGTRSVAVITGEPGMGKTTLLQNAVARALRLGFSTFVGRCHDGGASSPLAPWTTILEAVTDDLADADVETLFSGAHSAISRVLPNLTTSSPDAVDHAAGEQQTVFNGVARLLESAADSGPVLLAFEDLHWADPITIRLLNFVVSELGTSRIACITTWRDTDVTNTDLASGLADLARSAEEGRIALGGLGSEVAVALHRQLFDQELSGEEAARLIEQTGGNPLFLVELLRSLAAGRGLEPTDTIRDVISRRTGQLPPGAERLLAVGALCPAGFTERLVGSLTDRSDDEALDVLEAALAAGLIEEDPDHPEKFRFSHALIAETLSSSLSGARQARLHAAIGRELETAGAPVDLLAHHFLRGAAAGSAANGAEYAHRAAIEAFDLWDYNQAAQLLEAGLDALDRSNEDDDAIRADLLIDLMQVRKHQDRAQDAHGVGEQAFSVAKAAGDAERMAVATIVYCGWPRPVEGRQRDQWLGYWSPPGPSISMLTACVDKLPSDHWLRPAVLIALAAQHFGEHEDLVYCAEIFDEAQALAREQNLPELEVEVLLGVFHKFQRVATIDQRQRLLDDLLHLCQRHGLTAQEVSTRRARLVLALDRMDEERAAEEGRALGQAAASTRDPLLSMYATVASITALLRRGEHDEAEVRILQAMDEFAPLGSATLDQLGLQYSLLARERGQLEDVEAMLRWKLDGYPGPAFAGPLASILTLLGRDDEAAALIADFSRLSLTLGGEGVLQFTTPCFFAEAIADLGDVERASWLYDALQGAEDRIVTMFDGVATYGCGSYYLGRLATVLGAHDAAERHFGLADHFHQRVGARPYHLRTLLARARLDHAMHRSSDTHLRAARALAEELGMTWLVDVTTERAGLNDSSTRS